MSYPRKVSIGVPQETGSTLFLIYINDFNNVNPDILLVKYADDLIIVWH